MEKTIQVEGMTCEHCKSAVEGALNKLNGVNQATVDLEQGNVTVTFDENNIEIEQMNEAIEDQGYDVINK
ncbi:copper chaperone CopZ [Mammaliicoccus stepanovicii]|uniref:Copper chaperone CopZ n=2 Tax=Mammaliicoccus stepanovicii TaxID=643214 RepID=A0A239YHJ7_9STAP|nr:copper chaperone CopZ [Mammaliicoccus stepanovicii]SNV57664.1 copper chaperone [Mammaliicoccus stepanovicii]